jgi:hypothetical protein
VDATGGERGDRRGGRGGRDHRPRAGIDLEEARGQPDGRIAARDRRRGTSRFVELDPAVVDDGVGGGPALARRRRRDAHERVAHPGEPDRLALAGWIEHADDGDVVRRGQLLDRHLEGVGQRERRVDPGQVPSGLDGPDELAADPGTRRELDLGPAASVAQVADPLAQHPDPPRVPGGTRCRGRDASDLAPMLGCCPRWGPPPGYRRRRAPRTSLRSSSAHSTRLANPMHHSQPVRSSGAVPNARLSSGT